MDTIIHALEIERPAADVYRAVATEEGLSSWWSTKVRAPQEVGGVIEFTFIPEFNPHMEITALDEPRLVTWTCVAGHEPWHGATFRFEIEALGDTRCRLVFRQGYAKAIDDVNYGIYNFNWGHYMQSLKDYVEKGSGAPHDPS